MSLLTMFQCKIKRRLSCRKCFFSCVFCSWFLSISSTLCKKKGSTLKCFVYMVNGLLWEPYVLLPVDNSNFSSAFKALAAQTMRDTEKEKKCVCYHCFKVTLVCSAHWSFCHVVECPFAPNKRVNKFQRCGNKSGNSIMWQNI